MRRAILLLFGLICATQVLAAFAEKRVALVIGISDYATLSKLNNPVPDAKAIAAALKGHGFQVTEHYDLPRAELLDALEEFGSVADHASVALVYYAGHGMEMAGRNVLAPKDMEIDCEKKTPRRALDLDELFSAISGAPHQVVLLDACRNDPFPQCPQRSLGAGGGFRGFARVSAEDRSLLIANSTLGGQLADDGVPGQHSPFATALLTRFSTNASNYLRDLLEGAAEDVQKASRGGQVPEILTRGGAVRICLDEAKCGLAAPTPSSLPAPRAPSNDPALEAWNTAKNTDSPNVLEAYIAKFGNSFYASLAKAKLSELNKKHEETKVALVAPSSPGVATEHRPGETFKDCDDCPEMMVVPAGEFISFRTHNVRIAAPFAVGKFEVTKAQYEAFVKDSGRGIGECGFEYTAGRSFRNPGFEQGANEPAVCLSWDDAKAYSAWLATKTGKGYRLLTEAEWEYAARGAEFYLVSARSEDVTCEYANIADFTAQDFFKDWNDVAECSDGYVYTSPVGQFAANRFGLHDMLGNVAEWVEDCSHDSSHGAPADGSAWVSGGDCSKRVMRDSGWSSSPRPLGSVARVEDVTDTRASALGMRVARPVVP